MKYKKKVTFLIVLFFSVASNAQFTRAESIINHMKSLTTIDSRIRELKGSPYMDEDFQYAKFSNHDKYFLMRYNAYQDILEINIDDSTYVLPKNLNYSVSFIEPKKTYEIFQFEELKKPTTGFFVVVFKNNNFSLLIKEKIKAFEEVLPKSGYNKYKPPTLKHIKDQIFIGYKNNTAILCPKKKRDFLKLFSNNSKEVEVYMKKNKLNFKNKLNLIQIFTFYDSLK